MRQATPREAPAHRGTPRLSTFRPPSARGRPSGPEPRTIFRPAGWTPAAPSKQPDRNAIESCTIPAWQASGTWSCPKGEQLTENRVLADRAESPGPPSAGTGAPGQALPIRRVSRFGKPECKSSENSRTGKQQPSKPSPGYPPGEAQRCALEKKALQRTGPLCQGLSRCRRSNACTNPIRRAGGGSRARW